MSHPIQIVELPTGAGGKGFTTVPCGKLMVIGLKKPELIGTSGMTTENSAYTHDMVFPGTLLTKPLVCGWEPVKSTVQESPRTRMTTFTLTSFVPAKSWSRMLSPSYSPSGH